MKFLFVLCFLAMATISLADTSYFIPVLERTETHDEAGQFALRYISGDGSIVSEQGVLKPTADGKAYVLVKEGEYSFTAPNGQLYRTKYVADHLGFRPVGDHLPKSVVA